MIIYEEILREFHRQEVKYVLVGGIAFNLLGGYRGALDMGILVQMTDENLHKVVSILKNAGYSVKQPIDPMLIADKETREDWIKNKNMKSLNFYKGERSYEEVDIIIDSPVDFEKAVKNAKKMKAGSLKLTVISPADLIDKKDKRRFEWKSREEKFLKGFEVSPLKKLEGLELMNELADKVLTKEQKLIRRKLRERH